MMIQSKSFGCFWKKIVKAANVSTAICPLPLLVFTTETPNWGASKTYIHKTYRNHWYIGPRQSCNSFPWFSGLPWQGPVCLASVTRWRSASPTTASLAGNRLWSVIRTTVCEANKLTKQLPDNARAGSLQAKAILLLHVYQYSISVLVIS